MPQKGLKTINESLLKSRWHEIFIRPQQAEKELLVVLMMDGLPFDIGIAEK